MADAREQDPTGHAPIAPGPAVQGANHPAPGEIRSVKVDMGQGPPSAPARRPSPRPSAVGGPGMIATAAVMSLLFGGAGAWAYERFLARPGAEHPAPAPAPRGQDPGVRKDLAGLEDRIKDLSDRCNDLAGQYKELGARVESSPKSAPAPDLGPIEQKVARVDQLSQQVEAIEKKVDPLSRKVEQYDSRLAELDQRLDSLRGPESIARGRMPGGRDRQVTLTRNDHPSPSTGLELPPASNGTERPMPSPSTDTEPAASEDEANGSKSSPPNDEGKSADRGFGAGLNLFRQKKYGEAYAAFRQRLQTQPDDARTWYYAALSYGLATGEWEDTTKMMVEEGVAREKAGKPAKPEIDSTLAGLTKETGKDWLAFYRNRAR